MGIPKEHTCHQCGVRFRWDGNAWLIAHTGGWVSRLGEGFGGEEPEPEIRACPQCRRPLQIGASRMEEFAKSTTDG